MRALTSIDWRECDGGLHVGAVLRPGSPNLPGSWSRLRLDHGPSCPCCHVDPVCAQLRAALSAAESAAAAVERWVVDASGRADLTSIADRIVSDDLLRSKLRFDGIVVVRARRQASGRPASEDALVETQCAVADRVIERRDGPGEADAGIIEARELVGVPLYDPATARYRPEEWLPYETDGPAPSSSADGALRRALHLPAAAGLTPEWLADWLSRVDAALNGRCLRAKAIFNVRGVDSPVALHALEGRWQPAMWMRDVGLAPQRSRCSIVVRAVQPMSPPSTMRFVAVQ